MSALNLCSANDEKDVVERSADLSRRTGSIFPSADLDEALDIGDFFRHIGRRFSLTCRIVGVWMTAESNRTQQWRGRCCLELGLWVPHGSFRPNSWRRHPTSKLNLTPALTN
jgi:hypothetical protein